jgi:hypothetical protein
MSAPRLNPLLRIYLHPHVCALPQKILFQSLHQLLCLTIFHHVGNNVKSYQSLGRHILALELDMEVFLEVLEPLVEVATPDPKSKHIHSSNIDFLVKKCLKRLLDYK